MLSSRILPQSSASSQSNAVDHSDSVRPQPPLGFLPALFSGSSKDRPEIGFELMAFAMIKGWITHLFTTLRT